MFKPQATINFLCRIYTQIKKLKRAIVSIYSNYGQKNSDSIDQ